MGIFVVFSIVVIAILLVAIFANESAGSMNFLLSILSSITGVFGFVLGFYFGQNQS